MGRLILRIMIFCLFLMMTTSAFAAQRAIISDGWYKIVPVHVQSKALDSAGAGKNAGTNLQIWDFVDAPQQKFYVQHRGNGWYSFKAGHCDLYVDAQGGVPRRGENVWLYTWNGTDAQLWGLYNAGDGYYIETKMQSNLVFDCAGAGRNNGNNVQLWSKENVGWHKWKFVQVSPPQLQMEQQVKNRITQLYSVNGYRVNSKFSGSGQCRGFANKVYQTLFSVGYVGGYTRDNFGASSYPSSHIVGSVKNFSSNDTNAVRNLFNKAKPGAFIQMGRRNRLNSSRTAAAPHSAILVYTDGNGAMFYEANADGKNTIKNNYYTWAQLAERNRGFTLYLPDTYQLR